MSNNEKIKEVVRRVLEDWAMMLVDDSARETALFESSQNLWCSSVSIKGPQSGKLLIVAGEDFVRTLTANLLGNFSADSIAVSDMNDAYGEMGNVTAGNFVTEQFGRDLVFELGKPEVVPAKGGDLESILKSDLGACFSADELPVGVAFIPSNER